MKALKIILSTVIVLSLLVFLVLPAGIGLYMKHHYHHLIKNLPQNANVTIKSEGYEWGWFRSNATLSIDIHPYGTQSSHRILLSTKILQGPIIFSRGPQGNEFTTLALAKTYSTAPSINLTGTNVWQFNNKMVGHFSSPKVHIDLPNATVSVNDIQGQTTYQPGTKKWSGNMSIGDLTIVPLHNSNQNLKSIVVKGMHFVGNGERKNLINYGKQTVHISQVMTVLKGVDTTKNPSLNNLVFSYSITKTGDTTGIQIACNINQFNNTDLDINNAVLHITLKDLNTKRLNTLISELQAQKSNITTDHAALSAVTNSTLALLRKGLTLNIDKLMIGTSMGMVNVTGNLALPTLKHNANMATMAEKTAASFQVLLPKTWLLNQLTHLFTFVHNANPAASTPQDQAMNLIKQWEDQQYLNTQGEYYRSSITYKNGLLLINGKTPHTQTTGDRSW